MRRRLAFAVCTRFRNVRLATILVLSAAAAGLAADTSAGLQKVVIVYKTHFDIGYTTMAREVVHGYRTEMADRVLDAIERNHRQPKDQQFVWTVSGWPMKQILWDGQSPERRQKLEQAHSRRSPGRPCLPVHHAHRDGGTGGPGARAEHLLDPRPAVRAAALHGARR